MKRIAGYPLNETNYFKHEGTWIRITDWYAFLRKIRKTKESLGIVCVHHVKDHRVLWVHAYDDYYYYFQFGFAKKNSLSYIM